MVNPAIDERSLLFTHHFFAGQVSAVVGVVKLDLTDVDGSVERVGAFFVHSLPTETGECFENGCARFVFLFILRMFDGCGTGESAEGLDANHGLVTFDVDPIAPGL